LNNTVPWDLGRNLGPTVAKLTTEIIDVLFVIAMLLVHGVLLITYTIYLVIVHKINKPAVDEELSSNPGKLVFPGTVLT